MATCMRSTAEGEDEALLLYFYEKSSQSRGAKCYDCISMGGGLVRDSSEPVPSSERELLSRSTEQICAKGLSTAVQSGPSTGPDPSPGGSQGRLWISVRTRTPTQRRIRTRTATRTATRTLTRTPTRTPTPLRAGLQPGLQPGFRPALRPHSDPDSDPHSEPDFNPDTDPDSDLDFDPHSDPHSDPNSIPLHGDGTSDTDCRSAPRACRLPARLRPRRQWCALAAVRRITSNSPT